LPEYDEGGLLKVVQAKLRGSAQSTDFVTDINYNPKGQRTRIKYGNGATTKYTYDDKTFRLTRLWTFRNGGTENLQDLNYTYDPIGNITEITDNAQQTVFFNGQVINPSQTFEYDALYRLTKATGREHVNNNADTGIETDGYPNINSPIPSDAMALRNYTRKWEYDDVGNILKLIHNANNGDWSRTCNYASDNNRLLYTKVGNDTLTYAYNEHGSMATMPHLQVMGWDFAERLSHVTKGTTEAYYSYDGAGERVRKVVEKNGIVETRLYLGGFEIFRKKVGNVLELERETLHVIDDTKRIAIVETLTVGSGTIFPIQRYQLGNNIESATLELDNIANIISYEEYYPYGETSYRAGRNVAEVGLKRYRYTGKEKDEESGLYYHGARYYACWLGRWTAVDPAGLIDGINLYMHCRGNPVLFSDPTGEYPVITITNKKTEHTADQRLLFAHESYCDDILIQVPLYEVIVTDTEDENFNMTFFVIRDAWIAETCDSNIAHNIAYEPRSNNKFTIEERYRDYPLGSGALAIKLFQDGSQVVHAEPNQAAVDMGSRSKGNIARARGIMVHIGGHYERGEEGMVVAASRGCFGIVNLDNSQTNPSNEYSNDMLDKIFKQADNSKTNNGRIEVIIQKREGDNYPKVQNIIR